MTIPFNDEFTGSDGDELEARTGWTLAVSGTYTSDVYDNAMACRGGGAESDGAGRSVWICDDQGSVDHISEVTPLSVQGLVEYGSRVVDRDNYYAMIHSGTGAVGARLTKRTSGTSSNLIQVSGASASGVPWRTEWDGTTAELFINGVSQGTATGQTDHQTETSQGIINGVAVGNVKIYDSWTASPLSAGVTETITAAFFNFTAQAVNINASIFEIITVATWTWTAQTITDIQTVIINITAAAWIWTTKSISVTGDAVSTIWNITKGITQQIPTDITDTENDVKFGRKK